MVKNDVAKNRRKYAEDIISQHYLNIDKQLRFRRFELLEDASAQSLSGRKSYAIDKKGNPYALENISGKKEGNSTEDILVDFSSDSIIQKLEGIRSGFIKLLDILSEDDKKIFHLRFGRDTNYDWVQIHEAMKRGKTGYLYTHPKQLYRRKDYILDTFADIMNY